MNRLTPKIHSRKHLGKIMTIILIVCTIIYFVIEVKIGATRMVNAIFFMTLMVSLVVLRVLERITKYQKMKDAQEEHKLAKLLLDEMLP